MATKKQTPSKKSPKPTAKTAAAATQEHNEQPRTVKLPTYQSFKLQKKITQTGPALPSAYTVFRRSLGIMKRNWKPFAGITLWYALVCLVLVQSFTVANVGQTKSAFEGAFDGGLKHVFAGTASFFYLLGTTGNSVGSTAGSYQLIWILIISLALIWTLRQAYAGANVRIRDGFYKGMYPFIPFVFVLAIIALQLAPSIIIGALFNTVLSNGLSASYIEIFVWGFALFLSTIGSLYMVSSSIFALYIVSLQDMTPLKALRSARQLVANRRWTVMRKILYLPFILVVLGGIIMIPFIVVLPAIASWLLFIFLMLTVPIMHSYLYTLYRDLL